MPSYFAILITSIHQWMNSLQLWTLNGSLAVYCCYSYTKIKFFSMSCMSPYTHFHFTAQHFLRSSYYSEILIAFVVFRVYNFSSKNSFFEGGWAWLGCVCVSGWKWKFSSRRLRNRHTKMFSEYKWFISFNGISRIFHFSLRKFLFMFLFVLLYFLYTFSRACGIFQLFD